MRKKMLLAAGLLLGTCLTNEQLAADEQQGRREIYAPAAELACGSGVDRSRPFVFWQNYIYDFMPRLIVRPTEHRSQGWNLDRIQKRLASRAHIEGICKDGRPWLATLRSEFAIQVDAKTRKIRIPASDFLKRCPKARIEFMSHQLDSYRIVARHKLIASAQKEISISPNYLGDGLLYVSCLTGPQSPPFHLFWVPIGAGPDESPPLADLFKQQKSAETLIQEWLQKIHRQHHPDAPALLSYDLDEAQLAETKQQPRGQEKILMPHIYAQTPVDLAWWIWNLPEHRQMLLSDDLIGFNVEINQGDAKHLAMRLTYLR